MTKEEKIDEYLKTMGMENEMLKAFDYLKGLSDGAISILCDLSQVQDMSRIDNGVEMSQTMERMIHKKSGVVFKINKHKYVLDADGTLNYSYGKYHLSMNGGQDVKVVAEKINKVAHKIAEEQLSKKIVPSHVKRSGIDMWR